VFLWPTWVAARAAQRANVPYVVSPRGMLVQELIERRHNLLKSTWISLFERSNLERATAIHVTSQLEEAELRRFGWKLPQIAMTPNGVDDPDSAPASAPSRDVREIAGEQPLILFLGRLSWKKGVDRLLRAFARTTIGRLAVVGPDDERLTQELSQLAASLQIGSRVRFLPRAVVGSDKECLFAAARLFVLSSYSENFGNTVLEALRRGVPVVVTPEVGAAEVVRASGGGLVVPGEVEPLAAAITRLASDPALARAMGTAGQRHVVEHFAWSNIAAQMEELYLRIRKKQPCSTRSRRFS
jgi:glycosyltransferase involved in cell wall biosynthesis